RARRRLYLLAAQPRLIGRAAVARTRTSARVTAARRVRGKASRRERPGNPEAHIVVAASRWGAEAESGAHGARRIEPGTGPQHAGLAVPGHPGGAIRRRTSVAAVVAVRDPLPRIAQHVGETESIRPKASCRR